jgi:ribosome biogenesis GTPase A
MAISWFPGHMAKTRRLIEENIKLVDIVVELADARIPRSSRNPVLSELLGSKPRLLILNKSDMSDPIVNDLWIKYYQKEGVYALLCDSISGKGLEKLKETISSVLSEKLKRDESKGIARAVKMMVVGVPNVGKSSFINRISGRKTMKVENRPGVTRDKQWVRLGNKLDLLDTPGILWPKFEDEDIGYNLAFTGAIKDTILDVEDIASRMLAALVVHYANNLTDRYHINMQPDMSGYELLQEISAARGFKISGGEIDTLRGANMVLEEFRKLKLGRISIERPPITE